MTDRFQRTWSLPKELYCFLNTIPFSTESASIKSQSIFSCFLVSPLEATCMRLLTFKLIRKNCILVVDLNSENYNYKNILRSFL